MDFTPNARQREAAVALYAALEAEHKLLALLTSYVARDIATGDPQQSYAANRQAFFRETGVSAETFTTTLESMATGLAEKTYREGRAFSRGAVFDSSFSSSRYDAVLLEIQSKLQAQNSRILRAVNDAYRDIISHSLTDSMAGGATVRQATQAALNDFANRGIASFTDRAGRQWGMAEYAEMATRTGMMRAALAGYTDEAILNGHDLVIVSDHSDECPKCTPWENKVLSLTGALAAHPECDGAMQEALAAGMFHPNCAHSFTVYIPGVTHRNAWGDRQTPAQNREGYQNRQKMREYERNVRAWKRRQEVALTPEEERYAKGYVDKWLGSLRELRARTGLPRGYGRTGERVLLSDEAKKLPAIHIQ